MWEGQGVYNANSYSVLSLSIVLPYIFSISTHSNFDTHNIQKEVDMWPFMYKKSHGMSIDCDLNSKIVWCTRFDRIPRHCVMMWMNQRLVQIQNQRLAMNHAEAMPWHRRQREQIIFHRLILNKLNALIIETMSMPNGKSINMMTICNSCVCVVFFFVKKIIKFLAFTYSPNLTVKYET